MSLFDQAMKRPANYNKMSAEDQWDIDKRLGILDWDGSCDHATGSPCADCLKKYRESHNGR